MKKFEEAERLIRSVAHADALAALETMPRSDFSERELAYYHILLTEASSIVGKPVPTEGIDNAIETFRYDSETCLFARAKYAKGLSLIYGGRYGTGQETLLEAYTGYLRCHDLGGAARALNRLAYLSLQQGDVQTALDHLENVTKKFSLLDDDQDYTRFGTNLALLYILTGQIENAELKCREIQQRIGGFSNQSKAVYYLVSAMPHAHRGNLAAAIESLDRCRPFFPEYPRTEIFHYQYLGWAHLLNGNWKSAEESIRKALQIAAERKARAESTAIKRLLADVLLSTERYAEAEGAAREAFEAAQKTNEQTEIAACLRIFGMVEQSRNNINRARYWLDKSLDTFNLILSRYQLADTRLAAADCAAYSADEKAYMLTLARDYFAREGIEHRRARAETLLEKVEKSSTGRKLAGALHSETKGVHRECPTIIAGSAEMKQLLEVAEKVAPSDITVFLTGPTGSGKDVLARYIHYHSDRNGQFVSVNAAAVPDSMIESELFGHAKGAFTGADQAKAGLFEMADNGTFYLNEIADATASFQAKLLEVIETRRVRRLGENTHQPVNFRLIAATNHDLKKRMDEGLFRPDLFHRLNEISIELPSLSERPEDIRPLVEYFLRTSGFDPRHDASPAQMIQLAQVLSRREWPGNIRQLRAEVNKLLLTSSRDVAQMIKLAGESAADDDPHRALLDALEAAGGNKSKAARALGIKESTLRYRLKKYQSQTDE